MKIQGAKQPGTGFFFQVFQERYINYKHSLKKKYCEILQISVKNAIINQRNLLMA